MAEKNEKKKKKKKFGEKKNLGKQKMVFFSSYAVYDSNKYNENGEMRGCEIT